MVSVNNVVIVISWGIDFVVVLTVILFRFIYCYIDLEWKVIYVGSAEDSSHDQTLEEVLVGPVPVGVNKFVLQSEPADFSSIPENDILGVTVVLVTCSYKDQEFVRVGYYVNNEYTEEYDPEVGPPSPIDFTKVTRQILSDKPRVTRFPIRWGSNDAVLPPNDDVAAVDDANNIITDEPDDVDISMDQEDFDEEDDDGDSEDADIDLCEEDEVSCDEEGSQSSHCAVQQPAMIVAE